MKAKINPKFLAMMAACAVVSGIGVAHAQGMPADAQQLVQTMRPMYMSQAMPDRSIIVDVVHGFLDTTFQVSHFLFCCS